MSGLHPSGVIEAVLDDPLGTGRAGSDGIGFVGPDVPIEVLLGSGRPFGHLPWRADGSTPWADRWLESSFPFWARSILEQWHAGVFDELNTVVFSRGGDASQRLYYYVAELQRRGKLAGPSPGMFDIAYGPRDSSLEHTEAAISALLRLLDVSARMLLDGIASANQLRRRFVDLLNKRTAHGALYERLFRAALWSDPTRWLDEVGMPESVAGFSRFLLAGSMPPDDRIHQAVDAAGTSVVAEAHALAPVSLGCELEPEGEPLERALAHHLRQRSWGPRAFFDRAAAIVEQARAVRADAVVLWLTREDEALAWSAPSLRRALSMAGLPTLILPAARWQADDGALERIAEFCRSCSRASA